MDKKRLLIKISVIFAWLIIWQIASIITGNALVLAGPIDTISALIGLLGAADSYAVMAASCLRIMGGFFLAMVTAYILGGLAYRYKPVEIFLSPVISCMRSVPVASVTVIVMLWMGSANLALFVVLLVAFPILYAGALRELRSVDESRLRLARHFHMPSVRRFRMIVLPCAKDGALSDIKLCVGMSFKAGAAAEVIAQPVRSLGEKIYLSKLYFDTAKLFAWTFIIVLLSFALSKLTVFVIGGLFGLLMRGPKECEPGDVVIDVMPGDVLVKNVTIEYDKRNVLDDFDAEVNRGEILQIKGKSGIGKSTALKYIQGDLKNESGTSVIFGGINVLYQETILIEHLDAVGNVCCFMKGGLCDTAPAATAALLELLGKELIHKPVSELSGGQRRRVEIVRTMLGPGGVITMDEPFTGLDEVTEDDARSFIEKYLHERPLIYTSHSTDEYLKTKSNKTIIPESSNDQKTSQINSSSASVGVSDGMQKGL